MHRLILALLVLGPVLLAVGCAHTPMDGYGAGGYEVAPVMPPPGWIFQETQAPLSTDFNNTEGQPPRMGESRSRYLWIPFVGFLSFAWMDQASVGNSMANGGLTQVDYADYQLFNVLGIYKEFTVIAHGN